MSRKKLKALTFGDYGINILASALGLIVLSWFFNFSWGPIAYSVVFCTALFTLLYSRGAVAAKIDLRSNEARFVKSIDLAIPLVITLISIIAIYSLFYFDILPAKNVVLKSSISESGADTSVYLMEIISLSMRILFLNVTGFMSESLTNPFILMISPATALLAIVSGYFFGMRKIYISEYIWKFKDLIIKKFNE